MAYEYRSGSQSFELPNPYGIENRVRFAVGSLFAVIGIGLLFVARARLAAGDSKGAADAYSKLLINWKNADPNIPALAEAKGGVHGISAR